MNILWECFEIAVNFFQGFIFVYFAYAYLGDKKGRRFLLSSGPVYGIILAATISFMNYLMVFEHFYALLYIAVIFIYAMLNLKGSLLKKVYASIFPILIMLVTAAFVSNFFTVLFNISLEEILANNNSQRFVAIIATQLMIAYFVVLTLKLMRKDGRKRSQLETTEWLLISIVLIISIIIGALLNFISLDTLSPRGRLLTVIAFVGIILINVVVCYLIVLLGRKNQAVRENEILKVQQEYNKQYIANAAIEYDAISKLRHDFRDSYTVVYALISEGKNQKAIKYIENNINLLTQTETFIKTNNDVVNAVINAKFSTAKSIGIDCSCFSVADFDGIDDTDLCRLLSNMLENAVTACINLKSSDKQLVLMITSDEYKYTFHLKNTIEKSVLADNPELSTTKSGDHGYGTKIIRDISEKYNGRCDFYEENSFFCCNVILRK